MEVVHASCNLYGDFIERVISSFYIRTQLLVFMVEIGVDLSVVFSEQICQT